MALPKLNVPKYKMKLPSDGRTVNYRPFLVKEEKLLLLATQSQEQEQLIVAIKDIMAACTDIKDIDKLLRQLLVQVLYPSNLYSIYETFEYIQKIAEIMKEDKVYIYMMSDFDIKGKEKESFVSNLNFVLEYMIKHFNMDTCKMIMSMTTFPQNIIKEGVNSELDILQNKYNTSLNDLYFLQEFPKI